VKDEIWQRDEIDSPCVKICVIHPGAGVCVGCNRTLEEIAGWSAMGELRRAEVMAELPGRAALLRRRRGGRTARGQAEQASGP